MSFEQSPDRVISCVVKTRDGERFEEPIESQWIIGAEGAHSVVRKALGLTFLGETREGDHFVVGDIRIKKPLLDRDVRCISDILFHRLSPDLLLKLWHLWGEAATKRYVSSR